MATRIHIVLPESVIEEIDELVGPRKRSEFIAEAIEQRLERERFQRALDAASGSLNSEDYPEWSTPEKTYEWVRKLRDLDNERLYNKLAFVEEPVS
jgi:Arc/MetJ-type ribon-helix-helix transcriptional regulator